MAKKTPSVVKPPPTAAEIHPARVAIRLRALREAVGLGPSEFADSVDIDRSSYSKIEKGEKPLHQYMAFNIATVHGVSMDFLYLGRTADRDLPERHATTIRKSLIGHQR